MRVAKAFNLKALSRGLLLGGLTLLLGISPLEYMAGVFGTLWLLVAAIGFSVGDRVFRS